MVRLNLIAPNASKLLQIGALLRGLCYENDLCLHCEALDRQGADKVTIATADSQEILHIKNGQMTSCMDI